MLIAKTALILALMTATVVIEPWLLIRAEQQATVTTQPMTYREWVETRETEDLPGADGAI